MKLFELLDCIVVFGGKRCGKSNLLAYMMKQAYDSGMFVYSNMSMRLGFCFQKMNSADSKLFLSELENLVFERFNNRIFTPCFLGIDEFPNIIHAQNWKEGSPWSKVFDQLGKVGITTVVTATNFNKVYNGFRETSNKRIICKKLNDDYYMCIFQKQMDEDYESYRTYGKCVLSSVPMREYYDTHEVMYVQKMR